MSIKPTFAGEMQLAGWSESHTGGCKVTFWLQGPEDLAAFRTLTVRKGNTAGHRFMAALVEIGDDEMPVQPAPVADMGIPISKDHDRMGPLAYWLVMRCNDPEFWRWLESTGRQCTGAIPAGKIVKQILNVVSRKEVDTDLAAEQRFHGLIRGPYQRYLIARGIVR